MLLDQPGLKDKIATALGKSPESIQASDIKNFIKSFQMNGILFQVKGQDLEVLPLAINKIIDSSSKGTVLTRSGLVDAIVNDPEGEQIITDMQQLLGVSQSDATSRIGKIVDSLQDSSYFTLPMDQALVIGKNQVGLYSDFTKQYLNGLASDYLHPANEQVAKEADIQLASFLGFVEQNKNELPEEVSTPSGIFADVVKAQGKKMLYLDGPQNVFNPDSFYDQAFLTGLNNAGCEGNSICTYSASTMMEDPLYLSSDSLNYFVRIWRPVNPAEQWAGFQAALMHVPENPRFYVVSPCMATAKIWKTTYNGDPTIFVYPQKVDLGDSASNYCYADSNLINEYTAIWLGSDVTTIVTTITGIGAAEGAMEIVNKVFATADPGTLAQGIIEGAISWPGWPFKELTWEQISANSGKIGIKSLTGTTSSS